MTDITSSKMTSSDEIAPSSELAILRQKIDEIDSAILGLLERRQNVSRQIVTKKALGSNVFRPDREVGLLRNLIAAYPKIDKRLIMGLWRHIISASIAEQKPDYTIAFSHTARNLAADHGAGYMQLSEQDNLQDAIRALSNHKADCVVVTSAELEAHAELLVPDEVVIAASIGFLEQVGQERGYILCRELPLASGDDMIVIRDKAHKLSYHNAQSSSLPSGEIVGQYPTPLSS